MNSINAERNDHAGTSERGITLIEVMIVVTIFILVATSIYGTLTNLTKTQGHSDSTVSLQLEGQAALNTIVDELRTAGFYRLTSKTTLTNYGSHIWGNEPWTDPHKSWDVPYLYPGEGKGHGVFAGLYHPPATHKADPNDEEYNATQEFAFVPIRKMVEGSSAVTASSKITWAPSGVLGATATTQLPLETNVVCFELHTGTDNINVLKRITRALNGTSTLTLGAVTGESTIARHVEAVRFDTAQTDSSLTLYTVKVTIWLRKKNAAGDLVQTKVQTRVKLRNSVQ